MVRSCSLKNCNNSVKQKYRFFLLPSVKKVAKRAAWLKKCGHLLPECLPTHGNSISLCEGHFEPDQFVEYGPNIRTILKPTAVPTIFIRNPPRVCDAIESMYEEVLNEENIGGKKCESDGFRAKDDEKNMEMKTRNINVDTDSSEPHVRVNRVKSVDRQKQLNKSCVADQKKQSPIVQLLQIKKNCMVVSTKQGMEIISTFSRDISPKVAQQSLSDEKNSKCLTSFSHKDQVKRLEKSKDSVSTTPVSSSRNNRITQDSKDQPVLMRLSESGGRSIHIQPSRPTEPMKDERLVMDACDNVNENIRHYTVSSTTNIDGGNIDVDKSEEMNQNSAIVNDTIGSGISSSSRNRDDFASECLISSIKAEPLSSLNADSPLAHSQSSLDSTSLRKRVHDLEVERDNAIRKYRHLALRLKRFERNLRIFLNDDQIRLLESESSSANTTSWSSETLQKSARIRCIVGARAYEYLRSHEHYPLPSFRTLYRHRDISKINEYTDEIIQDHMNSTINEVAAMGAEDSEVSDVDIDDEHIKIEMLEPEYENSMEFRDDVTMVESHRTPSKSGEITDDMNINKFVSDMD